PFVILRGDPGFQSETLLARELGYRRRISHALSIDAATFLNSYDHLRSLEPMLPAGVPLVIRNLLTAHTSGLEVTAEVEPRGWWRIHAGYAFLHERFGTVAPSHDTSLGANESNDPRHQFWLQSYLNPTRNL